MNLFPGQSTLRYKDIEIFLCIKYLLKREKEETRLSTD